MIHVWNEIGPSFMGGTPHLHVRDQSTSVNRSTNWTLQKKKHWKQH